MRGFLSIFVLEMKSLVRSRTAAAAFAAVTLWMVFLPRLLTSDGTVDGARELYVRYSLGVSFAVVVVSLGAAAAGSMAKERAANTLQLAAVRPVRHALIALARMCAVTLTGSAVMLLACAILLFKSEASRPCTRSLSPILESERAEAEKMYEIYMADPSTPEEVKKSDKRLVIGILERRARDRYESIPKGETAKWEFRPLPEGVSSAFARFRFSTAFSGRNPMKGTLKFGGTMLDVYDCTESDLTIALPSSATAAGNGVLEFSNEGEEPLMLRPRADVNILYSLKGDVFAANLFLAWVEMTSLLALAVAFCVFLGACFGRSVAVFSAMAVFFAAVAAPVASEEGPDEIDSGRVDRTAAAISRAVAWAVNPFDAVCPVSNLSLDRRIPSGEAAKAFAADAVLFPVLFSLLSAIAIGRRED